MTKGITIRVSENLKTKFNVYCAKNQVTATKVLTDHIENLIKKENEMKNVQTLYYHDTTTGTYHKLYELTGDHMEIDALIDFAGLSVEKIEEQLGFEIDYENLTTERE